MANKTVSVILPNYNYSRYISSRIDEILAQTYPVSEIIILDDASTDDSREKIKQKVLTLHKEHPEIKIKVLFNKENSGNVFMQWQKGIRLATSEYIWICELDDSAKPDLLSTAMRAFNDQNVVLSYVNSKMVNETGRPIIKDNLRKIKDAFRKNLFVFNTIPNVSAAVFKNQPDLVTFLDEAKQYGLSGDWLFYIKISQTGKIAYSRKILNIHRLHQKSVTKTTSMKERFTEMENIHQYVLSHNLASKKTEKSIKNLEQKLKQNWGL